MKRRNVFFVLLVVVLLASACAAPATPQVVEKVVKETVVVDKPVEQTVVVEKQVQQTVVVQQTVQVVATAAAPAAASEATAALKGKKIAAVFSGPVNDAGWTTSAYLGLIALRDKYGMDIAYTENVKPADMEQVFRDYAKAGYDMVLGHGNEFAEAIQKVAPQFPNVKFIQTNGSAKDIPNLYTITFSAGEGGYFVGMTACQITKSGKVAYVAGTQFPILDQHIKMTKQACKDLGKDVQIIESYVGGWEGDVAKAKELASADIESGVDVLILEADAADGGTIEAAKEAAAKGKAVKVISWVKDKNYLAPDLVIGGWEENTPRLIEYLVTEKIAKGEPGGHFAIGLKEGAVALNPFYGLVSQDIEKNVVGALQKYVADPKSIPTLEVRTDL